MWKQISQLTVFQRFFVNVIKCGPIPKHIAIIMDGNRRYANKNNVRKAEGHSKGFDKLMETILWYQELNITEITAYAFSIENFNRTKEEVDVLMNLAVTNLKNLLQAKDKIMEEQICIRIIGNFSFLSDELKQLIAEVVLLSRNNTKFYLNVAFAYTSRDEITQSMRTVLKGIENGWINVNDIDEELISKCLYTNGSSDPDILIRTSGEVRLSDFLLWQISGSQICFSNVLWPDFCIWDLLYCVFLYQQCFGDLQKFKKFKSCFQFSNDKKNKDKLEDFFNKVEEQKLSQLLSYLSENEVVS